MTPFQGQTIRISRSPKGGYCKDETWKKRFDDCLDCALKFDIWDYYSTGVGSAAGKCGLDATPKPVDGGASSKAESATAAASTTAVVTSAAPSQTSASSVSTAVEHATSVSSRRHDPDHHHDPALHHDPAHHHDPAPHASAMSPPIEQTTSESSHHHLPAPHASPISTPIEHTTSESSHHHVPAPHASAATGASAVASAPTAAAGELNSVSSVRFGLVMKSVLTINSDCYRPCYFHCWVF